MTSVSRIGMDMPDLAPATEGIVTVTDAFAAQQRSSERRSAVAAFVLALLFLLVPFSATFQNRGGPMDEGTLLVYPEMVQRGAIPYRDFETFYGPANPYLLAAVYTIFGANIEVERTVGLFYRVLALIALFGLTRRWGTPIATGCMLVAGLLLLPLGVVAYAWCGALACALSFIWAMAAPEAHWRCLTGGLLAALALAFRPDVGPAIILAACVLLQPLSLSQRLQFASGAALGLTPFAALFLLSGPEQMFNNLFLYPVIRCGPWRRIPIFSAEPFLVRLFFAQALAAAANIIVGIWAIRAHPGDRRGRVLLALALLGAGLIPQAWQRLDVWHLFFVLFVVIGILPLTLFTFVSRYRRHFPTVGLSFSATVMVMGLVFAIAPGISRDAVAAFERGLQATPAGNMFVHRGERSFPVPPQRFENVTRLLDKLEQVSKPGERLFVGPKDLARTVYCDTFIYHLMPKLRPATYFLEMNPMSANRPGSRLASDIASADWLVLNREWDIPNQTDPSTDHGSAEALNMVRNHFRFAGEYGPYALFRRAP